MSMIAPVALPALVAPSADVPTVPIYRLSVSQYHAMLQHGILSSDEPVELIHGWLVPLMGHNPPHRVAVGKLRRALERVLPPDWYADSQMPVTFTKSEPLPDGCVARIEFMEDTTQHPGPSDVPLIAEVSDTTLAHDRTTKKQMYAEAAIPTYWIVNLPDQQVEVYTDPSGTTASADYATRHSYAPGDVVPVVINGQVVGHVAVDNLLS